MKDQNEQTRGSTTPAGQVADLMRLVAEQAHKRAERQAVTLPLLVKMGAGALAAELRIQAGDDEQILQHLGRGERSFWWKIADRVEGSAGQLAEFAVGASRAQAKVLSAVAAAAVRASRRGE